MEVTDTLRTNTKDVRQAVKMAREAKALRKKAKRQGSSFTREQQHDLRRAERYLENHPVNLSEPEYELA